MTMMKSIGVMAALLLSFAAHAQQSSQKGKSANAGQEVSQPGQATAAAPQQVTDTTAMTNSQAAGVSQDTSNTSGNNQAGNTPTVSQSTSSSSGSPAVLSKGKGNDRDGTNNVQRASMNMAGSPVGNLDLDAGQTVDVDSELRDRQDRSREKEASAQKSTGGETPDTGSIDENTRRENNALSDQNLSSKDRSTQESVKNATSRKKKNKTKKEAPASKKKG